MLKKRTITKYISNDLKKHEIIILHGTRQTGKTSLTKLIAKKSGLPQNRVFFFDFEDKYYRNLFSLENMGLDALKNILQIEGVDYTQNNLIVFDEVQLLDDPSNLLKLLHDNLSELKIIATGSSSLQMKHKFFDSFAGRKNVFTIQPLSFDEFLDFKNQTKLLAIRKHVKQNGIANFEAIIKANEANFLTLFDEYLTFGGYPEVTLTDGKENKIKKLHSIANAYIQKDIKEFANIDNIEGYNNLLKYLAINSGNLINISSICSVLGMAKETVAKYLEVLTETFIIGKLRPFYTNKTKEISKNSKYFFKDNGVRNLQFINFNFPEYRQDKGIIYENYVYNILENEQNILRQNYFYRTQSKTEIDFVSIIQDKAQIIETKSFNYKKNIRAFTEFEKKYKSKFTKIEKQIINKSYLNLSEEIQYLPIYLL